MHITRAAEYAIRGMLYVASQNGRRRILVSEIASAEDLSPSFLAKIFQMLSQQNIVKSHRGVKGGFSLARNPEEISVREVVEICEGGIALNHCLRKVDPCQNAPDCSITRIWGRAQDCITQALEETSLADIL